MVYETLTPLGAPFGDCRLIDIAPSQSMPEMGFEMGLVAIAEYKGGFYWKNS